MSNSTRIQKLCHRSMRQHQGEIGLVFRARNFLAPDQRFMDIQRKRPKELYTLLFDMECFLSHEQYITSVKLAESSEHSGRFELKKSN